MGCSSSSNNAFFYSRIDETDSTTINNNLHYISSQLEEGFDQYTKDFYKKSLIDTLLQSFDRHQERDCLGYRKKINENLEDSFTFYKYKEIKQMSFNFAYNLRKLGIIKEQKFEDENEPFKFIGVFSKNCVEYVSLLLASQLDSHTYVPFYATLGEPAFEHIFNLTSLNTICLSPDTVSNFVKFKENLNIHSAKYVILFDLTNEFNKEALDELQKLGLNILSFKELIKEPESQFIKNNILKPQQPEGIFTLCFTSGTTNLPKGVKISQRAMNSQMGVIEDTGADLNETDSHLSYLPLAHAMEQLIIYINLCHGARIGFISGEVRKFLQIDLKILKVTYLFAVPRVLQVLVEGIISKINNLEGCKKSLALRALRVKKEKFMESQTIEDGLYDNLIFSKIHEEFGGKFKFIVTGSSPLSKELSTNLKIIFGCPVIEGYGMTECSGASSITWISDLENNSVGGPVRVAKIKLSDVPELGYTSESKTNDVSTPCGEICVKGPFVFSGYFRDKKNTDLVIDKDGWLHTGDVAMLMLDKKQFKIIDRVKEIFKLAQGEYIAPTKLESVYSKCELISQICVLGRGTENFLIGIVVLKKPEIQKWLQAKEFYKNDDVENYYERSELHNELKTQFDNLAKINKFNSLEKIGRFIISKEEFTIDNQLLTPTAKVVRKKVELKFINEIDRIYSK